MRKFEIFCRLPFIWLLIATSVGCVSKELDERLEAQRESLSRQQAEMIQMGASAGQKPMDWDTAVRLLNERNITLAQARSRVEQIKRNKENQWKNWLPRIGAQASLVASLSNLGSLSSSDLDFSVFAPLNIPTPQTERARAFANALSYLESKDSLELTYRRQVASLYRLFSQFEQQMKTLDSATPFSNEAPSIRGGLRDLEEHELHKESLSMLQGNLAQLLNLPGEQPLPIPSTRPDLDYRKRLHQLVPGKNYGQLALRLSAYQLEGALLREKGIELDRWPTLSLSGTAPTIYDSRQTGSSGDFDSNPIYLFSGLSKTYDFTGREAENINTAKENTEFVRQNLRLRMDQESREWTRLKARYKRLLLSQELMSQRLQSIRKGGDERSAYAGVKSLRDARNSLNAITRAKEQLELEMWIWDDQKWN